jgi:hypothetical protein
VWSETYPATDRWPLVRRSPETIELAGEIYARSSER